MVELRSNQDCCGCMACVHVCRHGAISVTSDAMGFAHVKYDASRCVECGECDRVCDFNASRSERAPDVASRGYAVRHKAIAEVERSQSGAAFAAISDEVLRSGGVVYGAAFGEHFKVVHRRGDTAAERDAFRGSKYVQSDMMGIYPSVRKDLREGRHVLFTGTPCQVAAMRRYIPEELQTGLLLVDVICHGVSAPGTWQDYVRYLERKQGSEVEVVKFRDKKFGWSSHYESFRFADGSEIYPRFRFYSLYTIRKSCARCPYCNLERPSDLTIGDYWGLERLSTEFANDNRGCSLVLVNTEKGARMFDRISDSVDYLEAAGPEQYSQPNLISATVLPPKRERFELAYKWFGIRGALWAAGYAGLPLLMRRSRDWYRRNFGGKK